MKAEEIQDNITPFLEGKQSRLTIGLMLMFGLSNKAIRRETRCSNWYIGYVARRLRIYRRDYRDGLNDTSKWVMRSARDIAQTELRAHIRALLNK